MNNNFNIIFCPKCGTKQQGNNFCSNCGNNLVSKKDLPQQAEEQFDSPKNDSRRPYNQENIRKIQNNNPKPVGFYGKNKYKITRHSAYRWYLKKYRITTLLVTALWNIGVLPVFLIPVMVSEMNAIISFLILIVLYYLWNDIVGKLICKSGLKKFKEQNPYYDFD